MAKSIIVAPDHFTAHITVSRVLKAVEQDSYDASSRTVSRESSELINLTLRADTLDELKVKVNAAIELA